MKIEADTPSEAAADPQHPRHAQWAKQSLIEDEAKQLAAAGVVPDMRRIESDWVASLERVSKRQAEQKRQTSPRRERAEQAAKRLQMRYEKGQRLELARSMEVARALRTVTPRQANMFKRIRRLMAIHSQGAGKDPAAEYPYFVRQIAKAFTQHGSRTGDFKGRTRLDRERILAAKLERICDASKGVLGEWDR